jgi:HAD superfamily hydrolase (TIGR01509 family)
MARSAPSGALFDLYGTLLCYGDMERAWADWLEALSGCLEPGARGPVPEELQQCCRGFFSRPEPGPAAGSADEPVGPSVYERRILRLLDEMGRPRDLELARRAADLTAEVWQRHITLDPEALEVLEHLDRHLLLVGLVTNFDHPRHVRRVLEQTGLAGRVRHVVISGEVGCKKPDPRIFLDLLGRVGLDPGAVVHVGDAPEDVAGARAAGVVPIQIEREQPGSRAGRRDVTLGRGLAAGPHLVDASAPAAWAVVRSLGEVPRLVLSGWPPAARDRHPG